MMYWWNILYFVVSAFVFVFLAYLHKDARIKTDPVNYAFLYLFIALFVWGVALAILGSGLVSNQIGLCQ
jgi:hypothetical protein